MPNARNITVYCSSSDRLAAPFYEVATAFGAELAHRGDTLVYGGGRTGLMGAVARGAHAHKGQVVGVIPGFLRNVELVYDEADELVITADMRGRKAEMERRADAFVVLPGGLGTLEELAEILTLKVLRQLHKPLVILNQDGFYTHLLTFFDHLCEQRFAHPACRQAYHVARDIEGVFAHLDADDDAGPPPGPLAPAIDRDSLWMIDRKK
ncbi:MAG: TIGR00730 family Rossman fold protein [Planctomycetota bacterium]|nr:TIGR00730 family Rossman fold protein [Planctomycetota bacterium]